MIRSVEARLIFKCPKSRSGRGRVLEKFDPAAKSRSFAALGMTGME